MFGHTRPCLLMIHSNSNRQRCIRSPVYCTAGGFFHVNFFNTFHNGDGSESSFLKSAFVLRISTHFMNVLMPVNPKPSPYFRSLSLAVNEIYTHVAHGSKVWRGCMLARWSSALSCLSYTMAQHAHENRCPLSRCSSLDMESDCMKFIGLFDVQIKLRSRPSHQQTLLGGSCFSNHRFCEACFFFSS